MLIIPIIPRGKKSVLMTGGRMRRRRRRRIITRREMIVLNVRESELGRSYICIKREVRREGNQ